MTFEQPNNCADLELIFGSDQDETKNKKLYFSKFIIKHYSKTFNDMFADIENVGRSQITLNIDEYDIMKVILEILLEKNADILTKAALSIYDFVRLYLCACKYEIVFIMDTCVKYKIDNNIDAEKIDDIVKTIILIYGNSAMTEVSYDLYNLLSLNINKDNIVMVLNTLGDADPWIIPKINDYNIAYLNCKNILLTAPNLVELKHNHICKSIRYCNDMIDVCLVWSVTSENKKKLADIFMRVNNFNKLIHQCKHYYLEKFHKLVEMMPDINHQNYFKTLIISAYEKLNDPVFTTYTVPAFGTVNTITPQFGVFDSVAKRQRTD